MPSNRTHSITAAIEEKRRLLRSATLLYNTRGTGVPVVVGAAICPQSASLIHAERSLVPSSLAPSQADSQPLDWGGSPTANATCASFFGIGNSAECTSNLLSGPSPSATKRKPRQRDVRRELSSSVRITPALQARGLYSAWPSAQPGGNNSVTPDGAIANFAANIGGNSNTVATTGSLFNTPPQIFWAAATRSRQGAGYVNWARNVFTGDGSASSR